MTRLVSERADGASWKIGLENVEGWTSRLIGVEGEYEGDGIAFKPGDVLFGKLRPYLAKGWVADRDGAAVGDFLVLRPSPEVDPRFILNALLSPERIELISSSVYGAKMPRASWGFVRELEIDLPQKSTQESIVAYVNRATAEIDAFIADQEELIGLLAERRAATISHTVRRGLDPFAPMKHSGVSSLGEIPTQWDVRRLKDVALIRGRIGFRGYTVADLVGDEEGAITLSPGNILDFKLDVRSLAYLSWAKYDESPEIQVIDGDLILVKTGSSYGKLALVAGLPAPATINPQLVILRALAISPDYLYFAMVDERARGELRSWPSGGATPTITEAKIGAVDIAVPPGEVQMQIVNYLKAETAELDAAVADARKAIALSRERRAGLISAAVTGKIDVRGVG